MHAHDVYGGLVLNTPFPNRRARISRASLENIPGICTAENLLGPERWVMREVVAVTPMVFPLAAKRCITFFYNLLR